MQKTLIVALLCLASFNAYAQARAPGTELDNGDGAIRKAINEINEENKRLSTARDAAIKAIEEVEKTAKDLANQDKNFSGKVIAIADGDTLTVLNNATQRPVKVRINEIDAPEKSQPFGQKSKEILSSMCFNTIAQVIYVDTDRYGRVVGDVYCGPKAAGVLMVISGNAWVYDKYASKDSLLYEYQDEAKKAQVGLWADSKPIPPWEWRKLKK